MSFKRTALVLALLLIGVGLPSVAAADDIEDLKRALKELQEQNAALARRIATLEATTTTQKPPVPPPAAASRSAAPPPPPPPATESPAAQAATVGPPPASRTTPASNEELDQRVRDLELSRTAQESATRSIIGSALAKSGPKINEFMTLGGSLEVLAGNTVDFNGLIQNDIILNTAELDFDIKVNEWASASFILGYDSGTTVLFPTTQGNASGIDRLTVDRAMITLGDPLRFPFYLKAGRDVIPFGTSTGLSRTSGLSLESPLTIQVFENRANWIGLGFEFPTPDYVRPPPPVVVPPVQPLVVGPLINKFAHWVGFQPSYTRPPPLLPTPALPALPPIYGSVNFFQGNDLINGSINFAQNINASLGYRASGHCGRPYEELKDSWICPWTVDLSVDFTSNVYASTFFAKEYSAFMNQIGRVPGIAANLKASVGPFSLIAEYNSVIYQSTIVDNVGNVWTIRPAAWQVALGFQFGWNPWVEKIGEQGTFVAVGYSRSQGLPGVTQLINGVPTRVGFVPESRLIMTASEWVWENVKLTFEASIDWDYRLGSGGTGSVGKGFFTALTYNF